MPLNCAKFAVGVAEETHHRHHAVDGVVERSRRLQIRAP